MALIFSKYGCITLNVINLANTLHALGFSVYLLLDTLWFFRWSLRASEMIFKCWGFKLRVEQHLMLLNWPILSMLQDTVHTYC